jgi:hypothetical protein
MLSVGKRSDTPQPLKGRVSAVTSIRERTVSWPPLILGAGVLIALASVGLIWAVEKVGDAFDRAH